MRIIIAYAHSSVRIIEVVGMWGSPAGRTLHGRTRPTG